MSERKHVLHYQNLDLSGDIDQLLFPDKEERGEYAKALIEKGNGKVVYTLVIERSEDIKEDSIYIFQNIECVEPFLKIDFLDLFLFEWDSYEDAYTYARDVREENELCYN